MHETNLHKTSCNGGNLNGSKHETAIQIRGWNNLRDTTDCNGLRHAGYDNIFNCKKGQPITLYSNGKMPKTNRLWTHGIKIRQKKPQLYHHREGNQVLPRDAEILRNCPRDQDQILAFDCISFLI